MANPIAQELPAEQKINLQAAPKPDRNFFDYFSKYFFLLLVGFIFLVLYTYFTQTQQLFLWTGTLILFLMFIVLPYFLFSFTRKREKTATIPPIDLEEEIPKVQEFMLNRGFATKNIEIESYPYEGIGAEQPTVYNYVGEAQDEYGIWKPFLVAQSAITRKFTRLRIKKYFEGRNLTIAGTQKRPKTEIVIHKRQPEMFGIKPRQVTIDIPSSEENKEEEGQQIEGSD